MSKFAKAITAAITAMIPVYVASAILNNPLEQAGAAVVAGVVAFIAVYQIPNAPAPPLGSPRAPAA